MVIIGFDPCPLSIVDGETLSNRPGTTFYDPLKDPHLLCDTIQRLPENAAGFFVMEQAVMEGFHGISRDDEDLTCGKPALEDPIN